jgi:pantoate--beta-alanine ligase
MGALHEGHASLIRAARHAGGFVAVSIFVNPTQFGPNEDYARYPRPRDADLALCRNEGVDLVFAPSAEEMYPAPPLTTIHMSRLTETLCGPLRPGHFDGVCTVVMKLFAAVEPDAAYFGEKDAQQLAVVRQMVRDLNLDIEIIGCPIVREADGLALSSRNAYLSADERRRALALSAALQAARQAILAGERDGAAVGRAVRSRLEAADGMTLEYAAVVDPDTLEPLATIGRQALVAVAARVGGTHLIDNVLLRDLARPE